ncbi:MAG TPA: AraC family transcriptional regulator [Planctomycetota bacterium]|nr:AraC family transcriptional regulator [Planctomycetota bacterium]
MTVVDYRHEPGARPDFHLHGALEIGWCRSGTGALELEDHAEPFRPGDVFAIGGGIAHAARTASSGTNDWTYVFIDVAALLGGGVDPELHDAAAASSARFRVDDATGAAALALIDEFRRRGPCWRDAVRARLIAILVACRRLAPRRPRARRSVERMRALEPALAWIAAAYASPPPITALARRCRLSPSQFRRAFLAQCGTTPRAYLLNHRVDVAAGLLIGTDRAVTDIAHAVGFASLSSFNRQFQRRHACSPRRWRARRDAGR